MFWFGWLLWLNTWVQVTEGGWTLYMQRIHAPAGIELKLAVNEFLLLRKMRGGYNG